MPPPCRLNKYHHDPIQPLVLRKFQRREFFIIRTAGLNIVIEKSANDKTEKVCDKVCTVLQKETIELFSCRQTVCTILERSISNAYE
jgi:hypothetical protein